MQGHTVKKKKKTPTHFFKLYIRDICPEIFTTIEKIKK